jgi:hypothetical protein
MFYVILCDEMFLRTEFLMLCNAGVKLGRSEPKYETCLKRMFTKYAFILFIRWNNTYKAIEYAYMHIAQQFCFNRCDWFNYLQKYEMFRQNVLDIKCVSGFFLF